MTSTHNNNDLPVVAIVDGNRDLYRYYHTQPPKMVNGQRVESATGVFNAKDKNMKAIKNEFGRDVMYIVVQDAEGKNFRHDIFNDYKIDRKGMPAELKVQEPLVERLFTYSGVPVVSQSGFEGDDVIGMIANHFKKRGHQIVICGNDKDLHQLVDDKTSLYDASSKKFTRTDDVIKKFGVTPKQIPLYLALVGDKNDGIPGIEKIGDKSARDLISRYPTIEDLIGKADEIPGAQGQKIRAFKDELAIYLKLSTINDNEAELKAENIIKIDGIPFNKDKLDATLRECGIFNSTLSKPLFDSSPIKKIDEIISPAKDVKVSNVKSNTDQMALF